MGDDDLGPVSDEVLRESEAVRRLEREKRTLRPSAPAFRRLARDIETRARRLLRLTRDEESAAERTHRDVPIDDAEPDRDRPHGR